METTVTLYQTKGRIKQATIFTSLGEEGAWILLEEFRSIKNDAVGITLEELKQIMETTIGQLKREKDENGSQRTS